MAKDGTRKWIVVGALVSAAAWAIPATRRLIGIIALTLMMAMESFVPVGSIPYGTQVIFFIAWTLATLSPIFATWAFAKITARNAPPTKMD